MSKPLRLAIYLPDFYGGGVERISLMLIDALIARGIDVSLVVHMPSGDLRALLPSAVRLISLDARRSLTALPKLAAYMHRDAPDVLLANLGHNNIVAIWARILARLVGRCKTQLVICQHNALSIEAAALGNWQHRVLPRLYRWFGPLADAIVGVSHGVSDDMAITTGIPRNRITTIHNPVLDNRFEAALAEPSTHRWLQDPTLQVVIGIGRLVPQKDFATLIKAFAMLNRPGTRLLILGVGPERARLEQLAAMLGMKDRIDLPGFQLNPVPSLRDSRVMVLSSIYEGFGNVLVEALAAGVPVVSTRCPYGPDEILQDGRYGELVPVGHAMAMAQAIGRQLDRPRPSRDLRQTRAQAFHIDRVAMNYLALFESMTKGDGADVTGEAANEVAGRVGTGPGTSTSKSTGSGAGTGRGVFIYLPFLHLGGAEISLTRLAAGFAEQGESVTLVVHDGGRREIDLPAGVRLLSLDTRRSLFAVQRLSRALRIHRPAVLLTAFPHSNVVAVLARKMSGIDCRLVLSDHAPISRQVERMGGWRYRLLPPFARWAYPRADAVVAVSEGVRDDLAGMIDGIEPRVIHNPVLGVDWAARAAEPVDHPWLNDPTLQVALSVSRLATEKCLPLLVRAFAVVATSHPNARLLIAGDGPQRLTIERCIERHHLQDRVQLVGAIRNPLAWMRRARVFVLASQYEGFGNVLVEALAAGTRVVSTDCPVGPREVLQDGKLGCLVPMDDAVAMSVAIAQALDEDAGCRGSIDPEGVARHFTQARACNAYLDLFRELGAPITPATPAPPASPTAQVSQC